MPIRPENKARYPKDWKAISAAIRERAGHRCEQCAAVNGEIIGRGTGIHEGTYMRSDGEVRNAETGEILGRAKGSEYPCRFVKVVLTTAHLNHIPEDCRPENLKSLCQLHHLRYDAKMKAAGIKARRRATAAVADLFTVPKA